MGLDMQLRRFTAESTPAALDAVRMSLGDEAIILANRRQGDLVEIIATGQIDDPATMAEMSIDGIQEALDKSAEEIMSAPKSASAEVEEPVQEMQPRVNSEALVETKELAEDVVDISELSQSINAESLDAEPLAPLSVSEPEAPAEPKVAAIAEPEIAPDELEVPLQAVSNHAPTAFDQTEQTEQLLAALDAQNKLLEEHFKGLTVNLWGSNSPVRTQHLQHLLTLGIGAELAIRLVERADSEMPLDAALRQSYGLLKSTLPVVVDKTLSVPGVTIMSGAPGSGKTTALVKLATEHVKKEGNQSIVIICADTRRIGAFEELQAYGRLLGVPTVHAHDSQELDSLIEAFKHKQLVLIDHTLPNDDDAIELPTCLTRPSNEDAVRHLFALPATTQSSTAEDLLAKHCKNRNIRCVLTHLDSNARLGELFNAIIRHHLPIAYWSDSASVQRPLQHADASVLVATAVAMSRRIERSPDDVWLQRLIQPSSSSFTGTNLSADRATLEAS